MSSDRARRIPKYRHYKPKNLAVVRIDGERIYLGKYGTEENREKYRRIIADFLARKQAAVPNVPGSSAAYELTVNDLILAYWRFVESYYVKDGKPSEVQHRIRWIRRDFTTQQTEESQ